MQKKTGRTFWDFIHENTAWALVVLVTLLVAVLAFPYFYKDYKIESSILKVTPPSSIDTSIYDGALSGGLEKESSASGQKVKVEEIPLNASGSKANNIPPGLKDNETVIDNRKGNFDSKGGSQLYIENQNAPLIQTIDKRTSIIQKNVLGDNIIYNVAPNFTRELTPELRKEIISTLAILHVNSVSIRYEHSTETVGFVGTISNFIENNGFKVYQISCMMSEIKRNEFSIQKHPSDPSFAIIKIGTLL